MARGKRKQSSARREERSQVTKPVSTEPEKPSVREYLLQMAVFVVFCLISALLIYLATGYTLGLPFFFGVLILGFFAVCVFSYLHDRLYRDEDEVDSSP
ncbi:MAG TPA: hypothetical protein ENN74_01440 [Firmicutes bacterium]|nr:hypothetical protein [Bacillota bacterium]